MRHRRVPHIVLPQELLHVGGFAVELRKAPIVLFGRCRCASIARMVPPHRGCIKRRTIGYKCHRLLLNVCSDLQQWKADEARWGQLPLHLRSAINLYLTYQIIRAILCHTAESDEARVLFYTFAAPIVIIMPSVDATLARGGKREGAVWGAYHYLAVWRGTLSSRLRRQFPRSRG